MIEGFRFDPLPLSASPRRWDVRWGDEARVIAHLRFFEAEGEWRLRGDPPHGTSHGGVEFRALPAGDFQIIPALGE